MALCLQEIRKTGFTHQNYGSESENRFCKLHLCSFVSFFWQKQIQKNRREEYNCYAVFRKYGTDNIRENCKNFRYLCEAQTIAKR